MKILTKIAFLACLALLFSARAGVTNITIQCKTEIAGVGTNQTSLKFQQDGSPKDALTVAALVETYTTYKTTGVYTNTWDEWLKDTAKAAFQANNAAKSARDLGAAAAKVAAAASTDTSLFTAQQKLDLIAMAATLP